MADYEIRTEKQVKDKIKAFNKQRVGLLIAFIILIGILVFSPATEAEALPCRLSIFCSASFLLCGAAFVLTFLELLLLLVTAIGIPAVLLGLGQIRSQPSSTPEQLANIYRCCAIVLETNFDLTSKQVQQIQNIQEQIGELSLTSFLIVCLGCLCGRPCSYTFLVVLPIFHFSCFWGLTYNS